MKKLILLLALIFSITLNYGQTIDEENMTVLTVMTETIPFETAMDEYFADPKKSEPISISSASGIQ